MPAPNAGFTAVAAGDLHSLGLKADGTIVAWGDHGSGRCDVPEPNAGFTAIAARGDVSLGIRSIIPQSVQLTLFDAVRRGGRATVRWALSQPVDHVGFHLWRQAPAQDRQRLSTELLDGRDTYEYDDVAPPSGPADYWLQELTTGGGVNWYGPARLEAAAIPGALRLAQNRPNPFNPSTSFDFDLPRPGRVVLTVHDLKGARVATLVDADLPAGEQSRAWHGLDDDGALLPSGVYFVRLSVGEEVRTVKVIMAR
ncbi:MAG: T9SS type A sorting domain-containing protein [bacterium]|nr:T9SS type A sorting domain-containing protein [bacterium]